jgi:hypothetical protein
MKLYILFVLLVFSTVSRAETQCVSLLKGYLNLIQRDAGEIPGIFMVNEKEYLKHRSDKKEKLFLPWNNREGEVLKEKGLLFLDSIGLEANFHSFLVRSPMAAELIGALLGHARLSRSFVNSGFFEEGGVFHRGPFQSEVIAEIHKILIDIEYSYKTNGLVRWYNGLSDKILLHYLEGDLIRVLERINSDWFFQRAGNYGSFSSLYMFFDLPKNNLFLPTGPLKSLEKYRLVQNADQGGNLVFENARNPRKKWIISVADLHEYLPDSLRRKHQVGFDFAQLPVSHFYEVSGEPFDYLSTRIHTAKDSVMVFLKSVDPLAHAATAKYVSEHQRAAFLYVNGIHPEGFYFLDKWIEYLPEQTAKLCEWNLNDFL